MYMKKILGFAVGLALLFPALSFAAADCVANPDQCQGGGNPALIGMFWGLLAGETPTFPAGATITDPWGKQFACPWFVFQGCYDITHTAWYAANR